MADEVCFTELGIFMGLNEMFSVNCKICHNCGIVDEKYACRLKTCDDVKIDCFYWNEEKEKYVIKD